MHLLWCLQRQPLWEKVSVSVLCFQICPLKKSYITILNTNYLKTIKSHLGKSKTLKKWKIQWKLWCDLPNWKRKAKGAWRDTICYWSIQVALVAILSVQTWALALLQSISSENGPSQGISMHDSDSLVSGHNLFLQFSALKREAFNLSVSSFPSGNWTSRPLATINI